MGRWAAAGSAEEALGPGGMRAVELEGDVVIAIARLDDGRWVAFDDTCTHEDCPLSEGDLEGTRVVCYCHNSAFDLETGTVMRGPAEEPIRIYPIREIDGELEIGLDE